jgi:S1-C subfamily serine protease
MSDKSDISFESAADQQSAADRQSGADKQGMPVLGCIAGSAAAIAGIREGDRLMEVNGVPVSDAGSYVAARALERDLMHVVIRRDAKLVKLTLHFESYTRNLLPNLTLN